MGKAMKIIVLILMVSNGLLFISNIYTMGDPQAAMDIHEDLAASASLFMINAKLLICFIAGILYLATAVATIFKKAWAALTAVIACVLFDGLYIVELIMWWNINPWVWFGFCLFGGLSLLFALYSWRWSRNCQV